jgi:hypothetical protein
MLRASAFSGCPCLSYRFPRVKKPCHARRDLSGPFAGLAKYKDRAHCKVPVLFRDLVEHPHRGDDIELGQEGHPGREAVRRLVRVDQQPSKRTP